MCSELGSLCRVLHGHGVGEGDSDHQTRWAQMLEHVLGIIRIAPPGILSGCREEREGRDAPVCAYQRCALTIAYCRTGRLLAR